MSQTECLIETHDLCKVFSDKKRGAVHALSGVSFSCFTGEVYGLLGPNGAGKTTTLRILSTVVEPSSGEARVKGYDILRDPLEVRRSIGFLSGTTGLYPKLTPMETLEYFGKLFGLSGPGLKSAIERMVHTFELASFAHVLCEKLSTGMKQRVNIARATIHDPDVLILDEPTTGLDVLGATATLEFIRSFRERQKCVLMSTHQMSEAEKVCDRVGIIHEGRLKGEGTVEELKEKTGKKGLEDVFLELVRGRGEG